MRLKEDSDSWKSSSIVRRDFKHDPGLPEDEAIPSRKKKKKKTPTRCKHEYGEWSPASSPYSYYSRRNCLKCDRREMKMNLAS